MSAHGSDVVVVGLTDDEVVDVEVAATGDVVEACVEKTPVEGSLDVVRVDIDADVMLVLVGMDPGMDGGVAETLSVGMVTGATVLGVAAVGGRGLVLTVMASEFTLFEDVSDVTSVVP